MLFSFIRHHARSSRMENKMNISLSVLHSLSHSECVSQRQWRWEGGGSKGACAPGGTVQGAAFGGEFGNSASGKLAFALQNGFSGFVRRLHIADRRDASTVAIGPTVTVTPLHGPPGSCLAPCEFDPTCVSPRLKCTKFDFRWGSTPDPNGGAYSAPPDSYSWI